MLLSRRSWLGLAGGMLAWPWCAGLKARERQVSPLKITGLKVTPIALPDPPLLAASGCHGPYFLRNLIEIRTDAGVTGIGETRGGQKVATALEKARDILVGQNAFAYRSFGPKLWELGPAVLGGLELACLDACGKATGLRLSELMGGPVRQEVEFAAYLFFRYAADHPVLLADTRIVDRRGRGKAALDDWGEVLTPATMAAQAARFQRQWGFKVFKLKAGVLKPEIELEALQEINRQFKGKALLRIDPNARWKKETAIRIGKKLKDLPLEYYEDPVRGQEAMAEVRKATDLPMSTNMCVTRFEHIVPALKLGAVDIVLGDHHYFGGITGCQELGRLCQTLGWKMSQHSNNHAGVTMAAMIHLAALVPQLTLASDTHYPWLPEGADIIQGPKLTIKDGKMKVPSAPGVGVALDPDRVARASEVYRKCGMRERDDAGTMQKIDPNFSRQKLF